MGARLTERKPITCPYCSAPAKLITGPELYGTGRFRGKHFWRCDPCDAHVGCHENSKDHKPLGRLANAELRIEKQKAHAAFDRLWRGKIERDGCSKKQARTAAYKWLCDELGIPGRDCHIGQMNVAMCRRVVEACEPFHAENRRAA